ncbi:MAG: endonuclease [Methanobacteriota archaeon]|nr:MAG: endonuclease [Euryarchaeota archaeon]
MDPDEWVIASFNLENLDNANASAWKERKRVLRPMLERLGADLLLLQEVNSLAALDDLIQGTDYEKFHRAFTKSERGAPYAVRNIVTLSRWPIAEVHEYRNDLVPAPAWRMVTSRPEDKEAGPLRWERPILYTKVKMGRRAVHVINVHLKSMNPTKIPGQTDSDKPWLWKSHGGWAEGFYLSDVKRVGQALEARQLIDTIFEKEGEDALIVIGGDFNAFAGSAAFKAVAGSVEDTQNPKLRSTVLIACEANVPPDQRVTLIHHGKGDMLDHVLVSQALYPYWIETDIFNEVLHDESLAFATDVTFPESDHAPVVTRFRSPHEAP